jgi:aspartate kinase
MLIVQKFGGTSVGSLERIEKVRDRVIESVDAGNSVVVVVSAMSGETNKLVSYAKHFSETPMENEVDVLLSSGERVTSSLLSIALNAKGYPAISMSGRKAGITTDIHHTKARIENIDPSYMRKELASGKVVIVAGFQGVNENGDVTTLGRGGSDLSAVAIAGALEADLCEIYTDVDGIYTTDPRIEPKAKKLEKVSYDEMLEMASLGAKVLQSRSVEMAKKLNVNLVTRSSFSRAEGTLIANESSSKTLSGVTLDRNQARVGIIGISDKIEISSKLFSAISDANINVDMIAQTIGNRDSEVDGKINLAFTLSRDEVEKAKIVVGEFLKRGEIEKIEIDDIVKVSIVGAGMKESTGIAFQTFEAMSNENINIMMVSTSDIKISMVIDEKYGELAVRTLHEAFELGE